MKKFTKVIFRKFPDGDVIAIFPDEVADPDGNLLSYMHVGQHGAASDDLIDELQPASRTEYYPLLDELMGRGYKNLKVIKPRN